MISFFFNWDLCENESRSLLSYSKDTYVCIVLIRSWSPELIINTVRKRTVVVKKITKNKIQKKV